MLFFHLEQLASQSCKLTPVYQQSMSSTIIQNSMCCSQITTNSKANEANDTGHPKTCSVNGQTLLFPNTKSFQSLQAVFEIETVKQLIALLFQKGVT